MQKKEYKPYIASLKGIACLFVMIGHFIGVVRYAEILPFDAVFLDFIQKYHLDYLFSEGFWLVLFFVASGYLCAQTDISKLSFLIVKCICRFFRFFFPVLFASMIIWILSLLVGFHNHETKALFQCDWFQNSYGQPLSLVLLLRSPFDTLLLGVSHFNNPYYVLREMLLASFVIYTIRYIGSKCRFPAVKTALRLLAIAYGYIRSPLIILPCVIGMCIHDVEASVTFVKKPIFSIVALAGAFVQLSLPIGFHGLIFFSLLILSLSGLPILKKAIEQRIFLFFSKLSFGIYSFHWPLLCTVGALLILLLSPTMSLRIALFAAFTITFLLTILISYPYHLSFEKWSGSLVKGLQRWLEGMFEKTEKLLGKALHLGQ